MPEEQVRRLQLELGGDITDRKRAEEAVREKTEELDRYFFTSLDLLCIASTERGRRFVPIVANPARLRPWQFAPTAQDATLSHAISRTPGRAGGHR
jgi:PAS domain-containing protein